MYIKNNESFVSGCIISVFSDIHDNKVKAVHVGVAKEVVEGVDNPVDKNDNYDNKVDPSLKWKTQLRTSDRTDSEAAGPRAEEGYKVSPC